VNGLNLKEMKASDMIDVLHYFFEDDMNYASAEQADAKDRSREIIYRDFYDHSYAYSNTQERANANYAASGQNFTKDFDVSSLDGDEKIEAFDPMKKPPKPFVPATKLNAASPRPFGSVLDEPLSR
jgi:hypothetical protein